MRKPPAWVMSAEEARVLLGVIEDRVRSSEIEDRHRDALIRFRAILEDDLARDDSWPPQGYREEDRAAA